MIEIGAFSSSHQKYMKSVFKVNRMPSAYLMTRTFQKRPVEPFGNLVQKFKSRRVGECVKARKLKVVTKESSILQELSHDTRLCLIRSFTASTLEASSSVITGTAGTLAKALQFLSTFSLS